jgi:hypothetical protein
MALLDEVQRMEERVARRLRELEPLVSEYEELKQVAERLGVTATDGKATPAGRTARRAPSRRTSPTTPRAVAKKPQQRRASGRTGARGKPRRNAAAPGSRQQDVLRLVGERPGISVPELGRELGVDPTGLYQIVRRLEGRGLVRKEGRELRPVTPEPSGTAGAGTPS